MLHFLPIFHLKINDIKLSIQVKIASFPLQLNIAIVHSQVLQSLTSDQSLRMRLQNFSAPLLPNLPRHSLNPVPQFFLFRTHYYRQPLFLSRHLPNLKLALVSPLIIKHGLDKEPPSNYGPTSNLNNISKF